MAHTQHTQVFERLHLLRELSQGLTGEQVEQLWKITGVMLDNAFKYYGKGSIEESDKDACKKPAGV